MLGLFCETFDKLSVNPTTYIYKTLLILFYIICKQ
jgi:hypothetical protein